jgi:NAD(P)-dependent dehydrogenase (short-subunit alcohol dehydrogenase family)
MADIERTHSIRFSLDYLELFSAASHDSNPLHLSEDYARKTPYGDRVLFGVLGGLACLGHLNDRPDFSLSSIVLEFPSPMFAGVDYTIDVVDHSPERATAKIYDGRRIVLKAAANFRKGSVAAPPDSAVDIPPRVEPADLHAGDLVQGFAVQGVYAPAWGRLRVIMERMGLAEKGVGAIHVAALMWCSYLVGMELPGRRALFSKLALRFADAWQGNDPLLAYEARVAAWDTRFDLLKIAAQIRSGGTMLADAELRSFVRQDTPATGDAVIAVEALLPQSATLEGKVALVVGASRGLGAAIAHALALQGCTVLANFLKSTGEAQRLQASASRAPGAIMLAQGDGSDLRWCQAMKDRIARDHGRLDFLVCNACPALLPLSLDPNAVHRINDYVSKSLALVSVPMAVFLDMLSTSAGWNIVISSAVVQTTPPAAWPHYVSAKWAIEGLSRVAAVEYGAVSFLVVRPPRLLTDLTNTPLGRQGALLPAHVAVRIAGRLGGPRAAGQVEVLEAF